ncbi:hypothetical protein PCK1_000276 [Pneumocystis canis]|nr:hypothetical protein PCK1_000276 [Pneumocystis canis]
MNIKTKEDEPGNELYESDDGVDKRMMSETVEVPGFCTVPSSLSAKYTPSTEHSSYKESMYKMEMLNNPLYQQMISTGMSSSCPVNMKQYHRILKRRQARAQLQATLYHFQDKPYLHESRHKHAMRRLRGPGGRFLSANDSESNSKKIPDKVQENETEIYDSSDKNTHQEELDVINPID